MKFIIAVDEKWGFSKNRQIPWHHPKDFQFFKNQTQGQTCVMGYNTFAELALMRKYPGKNSSLLPSRQSIVLTSRLNIPHNEDVKICHYLEEIASSPSVFFIGGASIYKHALDVCTEGLVTRIKHDYNCDQFFDSKTLQENFTCTEVLEDAGELRFERWTRKSA